MDLGALSVVILCGGRGTRLQEQTQSIPKPLVEIGGRPIVWHVVERYRAFGCSRFILCTGYRGEQIAAFAATAPWGPEVEVVCLDTGAQTPTGGRIAQAISDRRGVPAGERFFATYADGVADIDLGELLATHLDHGALATVTVVRPALPFGIAEVAPDGRIVGFREKPRSEQWVNGGFFCFEPGLARYLDPTAALERAPLERLAADGQLHAYRHLGFWDCMDTYKDAITLNDLWTSGTAPWQRPPARRAVAAHDRER